MDLERLRKLHDGCKMRGCDLYSYLEKELPQLGIEERLKVMAAILNEYLEEYRYDQSDKLKRQDYSITRFFPKS